MNEVVGHCFTTNTEPLDSIAIGYFLAFVLRNTSKLYVDLSYCSIDDHSLCVLMGELSKHAEASREGVLYRVTRLNISHNTLDVNSCDISDVGAESLARALAVNRSLLELYISSNQIGNNGIAHIATALQTNNTLQTLTVYDCSVTRLGIMQ